MVYTVRFFSLKCSLFHNSNLFGSSIIHILYTECAKIKKNNSGAKRLIQTLTELSPKRGSSSPSDRAAYGLGLRPLACWDYEFESRRWHDCLSLVSVVYCQVKFSASDWSFVQRNPIECGVSECDRKSSIMRWPWPTGGRLHHRKEKWWFQRSSMCVTVVL